MSSRCCIILFSMCFLISCASSSPLKVVQDMPIEIETVKEPSVADEIIAVSCNGSGVPFLLKVNGDGVMACEFGKAFDSGSYLDIFDVKLAEGLSLPAECAGVVSISSVEFPRRVRFIMPDSGVRYMSISDDGVSATVAGEYYSGPLHILRVMEERNGLVQTIKIFTSSSVEPVVEGVTGGGFSISLGKGLKPVSGLPAVNILSGPSFSAMNIEVRPDGTYLLFKSPTAYNDVDVYIEKTGFGFVVYAKKLR